ncbi:MAG: hypothetical protein COX07_04545 [Bacteroidetes bacterium CG23_combo_of_CG06-09_8_20_14_all_32_9]|nr:MAG: hypothetical protein COX07_04545 [Bacteroidetes bacterium CG23_combo_of_CG06-09_8_20_14_all_32_9]
MPTQSIKWFTLFLLIINYFISIAQTDLEWFIKSKVAEDYNKIDTAIFFVSKAIADKPNPIYLYQRAELFLKNKDIKSALNDFISASEKGENEIKYKIASCYTDLQNWSETDTWLRKYLAGNNKIPINAIKTDTVFSKFKTTPFWDEIWKKNWYSDYEYYLADLYYLSLKGLNSEAYDIIDNALKQFPKKEELWFWKAKAYIYGNNHKEVMLSLDKALMCNPKRVDILLFRADLLRKDRKNKKAINDYSTAFTIQPWNIKCVKERGITKIETADYNGAIADLLYYHNYDNLDGNSLYFAGHAAYLKGDFKQSISILNEAIKLNDGSLSDSYFERGRCYVEQLNYDLAFSDLCMAIDLNPGKGEYFYYRGLTYYGLKNKIGACHDWEKARTLNYLQAEQYMLRICNKK